MVVSCFFWDYGGTLGWMLIYAFLRSILYIDCFLHQLDINWITSKNTKQLGFMLFEARLGLEDANGSPVAQSQPGKSLELHEPCFATLYSVELF